MWNSIQRAFGDVAQVTGQMDREHWIVVFAAALLVGAFMLRGFGSQLR